MTLRSLSKNVEILPDSPGDEMVIRLSEAFSERLKGWVNGNPKAAAALLQMMLYDSWGGERCPRCGSASPRGSRYCIFCGKAIDRFAQKYERLQSGKKEEEK